MNRYRRIVKWSGAALGIAALALSAGCSVGGGSGGAIGAARALPDNALGTSPPAASAPQDGSAAGQTDAVPVQKADIISTGSLAVVVGQGALGHDFALASNDAIGAGGYVASTDTQLSGSSPYADLVLRMPEPRFAQVAAEITGLGKVKQESMQGQDVTGQVVDLGARISNLQSEEVALRQLMARTGSIPDILNVENQLFAVQQQVEELTAQRDSLVGQVAYATLTVDLTVTAVPASGGQKPKQNAVARGAQIALHNTASVLHAIALGAGEIFPLLLVAIVAGLLLEIRRRRRLHPASS